jgi:predicted  nucleic acid-binding Zn-ribbon protein
MTEELVKRLRHLHNLIEVKEAFSIPELAEAADAIEGLQAEVERLRDALRACRRAISAGRDEPRRNVREIVDEAIEEHDRHRQRLRESENANNHARL